MTGFGVDQDTLVASFAGAMAYLCTRDKMPVVRAAAYAFAGTAAAAYIGPGIVEYAVGHGYISNTPKMVSAVIFATGVGGIWVINFIVAVLQAAGAQANNLWAAVLRRFSGDSNGKTGGQ